MINTILASTALLATTVLAQGNAIVINSCNYPVYVTAVPASGGGASQIGPNTLQNGQSFTQQYTQLTNGDGWSIKLTQSSDASSLMQYEYTYQNDGTLWFDMSDVNGDPWGGDWVFTATGDCTPKQTAYQYSTDDAYGMQSCPDTSSVTVNLCGSGSSSTGGSGGSGGSWGSSPAASEPTSSPTQAPASAAPPAQSPPTNSAPYIPQVASVAPWAGGAGGVGQKDAANAQSQASTLATVVQNGAATVTNMHTVVVTEYITASPIPAPQRRHEHLHRHMAHHQH